LGDWVWGQVSYRDYDNAGHGRIESRALVASELLNDYLDRPGIGLVRSSDQPATLKTA
jgi:hypothetical protein